MKEIRFFAMMRSGQHAIINWLLAQLPEPHTFINDPLYPTNWKFGKKRLVKEGDLYMLYNLEDRLIVPGIEESKEKLYDYSDVRNGEIINVLIIRDPFNLFASRYARETTRKNLATGEKQQDQIRSCSWSPLKGWTSKEAVECWKSHVDEINNPTVINLVINYNQWVISEDYRRSLAEWFGVDFNDVAYDKIAIVQGEGSSFDGAKKGDTLGRYRKYKYDKHFMSIFDEETKELANNIFGWCI